MSSRNRVKPKGAEVFSPAEFVRGRLMNAKYDR
jgi:hypothetical protein